MRSNIAGYIPNKFKLLAVDNVDSTIVASHAQLTLTMDHLSMPQLPLLADGAADGVRFKLADGHRRLCIFTWLNAIVKE
jgi:hypothetical protein